MTLNDTAYFEAAIAFAERMIDEGGDGYSSQIDYGYKTGNERKKNDQDNLKYLEEFYQKTFLEYQNDQEAVHLLLSENESPTPQLAAMVKCGKM